MKKANKFYNWFKKIGGDVGKIDVPELVVKLTTPIIHYSSFKHRAQEVKDNFNYKFN